MQFNFETILQEEIDRCKMLSVYESGEDYKIEHPRYGMLAKQRPFGSPKKCWKEAIENLKMILEAKYYVVIKEK